MNEWICFVFVIRWDSQSSKSSYHRESRTSTYKYCCCGGSTQAQQYYYRYSTEGFKGNSIVTLMYILSVSESKKSVDSFGQCLYVAGRIWTELRTELTCKWVDWCAKFNSTWFLCYLLCDKYRFGIHGHLLSTSKSRKSHHALVDIVYFLFVYLCSSLSL